MIGNSRRSWGSVSRALHWGLAAAILGMLAYGWWMNHVAARPDRFFHRSIHADIGYAVLMVMVLRLVWRAAYPAPALPPGAPRWERIVAALNHGALYVATVAVALLGWAHSGAHKPTYADWFGLFNVPQFMSENRAYAKRFEDWHIWGAYVLAGLVALHILAALYHRFVRRDDVMSRMTTGAHGDQTG